MNKKEKIEYCCEVIQARYTVIKNCKEDIERFEREIEKLNGDKYEIPTRDTNTDLNGAGTHSSNK